MKVLRQTSDFRPLQGSFFFCVRTENRQFTRNPSRVTSRKPQHGHQAKEGRKTKYQHVAFYDVIFSAPFDPKRFFPEKQPTFFAQCRKNYDEAKSLALTALEMDLMEFKNMSIPLTWPFTRRAFSRRRTRTSMFTTYSGFGPLAIVGLLLIMITETALKAITGDPTITAPHSWWLMSGYAVAAFYCIALHLFLKYREVKLGYDTPGSGHHLAAIPVRYWSIVYIVIGFLRVSADR